MTRWVRNAALALALAASAGCTSTYPLMPTPHLYSERHAPLFGDLDPRLVSSRVPVFYVTDRTPETGEDGRLGYGFGRSASIGYGVAIVEIGEGLDWDEVKAASVARERESNPDLELREVTEVGRTPPTPFPYEARGGFYVHPPETLERARAAGETFRGHIGRWLDATPRKEILLYVHGYNNDFRDAILTWAGVWHFFGREGVPVVYTWPAGRGGLGGYAYDRESGEFSVYHLKLVLRSLASDPDVEGIRILAHSRGTDVLTSALRELFIESRAAGVDPRERFRIRQLVLAAPDMDYDVTMQRLGGDPIAPGVEHVTVYVSPTDKAIGLAEWLFSSVTRLGRLGVADLEKRGDERPQSMGNVTVVELEGDGGSFGHSYFYQNPAVASDVLQVLRFDRPPGGAGRPLQRQRQSWWLIRDDYLLAPD